MKSQQLRLSALVMLISLSAEASIKEESFDMELKDLETEAKIYELKSDIKDVYKKFVENEFKNLEEDLIAGD